MKRSLQRCECFMDILQNQIKQNAVRIENIEYSCSRDGSTGWNSFLPLGYWGENDKWYRFRSVYRIPPEFEGKNVKCSLATGRENLWNPLNPQFLVYINGHPVQALDTNHVIFELAKEAVVGDEYVLEFEAYAGRELSNVKLHDRPLQFRLDAFCHNALCERLYYDLKAAMLTAAMYYTENYKAMKVEDFIKDYRCVQVETYIDNTINILDFRQPGSADFFESVEKACNYIEKNFYEEFCGHEDMIANCIGHTHIDVAWMWRIEQTRAKAVRSFSTELALMEEYPEHLFTSSQPQLYQYVKEDCPEIYEKIKQRVKEGRWEVEGGMWLEADCNLTSGESLIRQILHGKRFMKQEFGVDSKVLWLPDVFGYSAALPQILNKTGMESFVTSKIHWSDTNRFPYDTFMWKGIDGSEIFTHFITAATENAKLGTKDSYSTYVGHILPITLAKGFEMYQQKDINSEILVSFGYGDGGGGVTREMLEMNRRLEKGLPGVPKSRITTVADAIARIKKNVSDKKLPKWFGELYLEYHRGTYTSIGKVKRNNRKSEFLLQTVEAVSLTDKLLAKGIYEKEALYDDWNIVLLNQFHDIIPGSSIREVYEDSEKQFEALIANNTDRLMKSLNHLAEKVEAKGILVYNPLGFARSGIVRLGGKRYYAENVPAWGWKVIPEVQTPVSDVLTATPSHMENKYISLDLNEKGQFISIYDKINQREILPAGEVGNVLEAFDDHPYQYDNWELADHHKEIRWEIDDIQEIKVLDNDGLAASLKLTRNFLDSTIEQVITIYHDSARVDISNKFDWHEHHIFVKAAFPVDVVSDKASYEIQYGAVERPAHTNTSWDAAKYEVCAHKWADYSEPDYGLALLNDCKYGYDIHDGIMRLSLIKCGTYPFPEADQGIHEFNYAIIPHAGDWRKAEIANEAYSFNCPLMAVITAGGGALPVEYSFVSTDQKNIFITVAKEACDSEDIILRAYESQGRRTKAKLQCGFSVKCVKEVDMLEQEVYKEIDTEENCFGIEFKPYEIKTFRVAVK